VAAPCVTHAEFICNDEDGQYYFLEIAARVGGAGIDRWVEHATRVKPWTEWARTAVADASGEPYVLPELRSDYAGLVVSLARQAWPDTSTYSDPEGSGACTKSTPSVSSWRHRTMHVCRTWSTGTPGAWRSTSVLLRHRSTAHPRQMARTHSHK